MSPEAVGVFDSFESLQAAINDLRTSGFSRAVIRLLGGKEVMIEKLGSTYWHAADLEGNPNAPRAAFVSEEAIGELEGAIVMITLGLAAILMPLVGSLVVEILVGWLLTVSGAVAVVGALSLRDTGLFI